MTEVVMDYGHGGSDGGAGKDGVIEKNWVLEVGKKITAHLRGAGISVFETRTNDTFVGLSQRAQMANAQNAKLFVSIHFNAGGGLGGVEDFVYLSAPNGTVEKQRIIHNAINAGVSKYGIRDRGMKRADYAVLRETSMDAILLEAGFVDTVDIDLLRSEAYKNDYALSVARGIAQIFGKTIGGSTPQPQPKPPVTKPPVAPPVKPSGYIREYNETGNMKATEANWIKRTPTKSAPILEWQSVGQVIKYHKVVWNDGHVWLQINYGGGGQAFVAYADAVGTGFGRKYGYCY